MSNEVTFKVKLEGSDGKGYVQTFEGLKKDLGIPDSLQKIYNELAPLRWQITYLQEVCETQLTEKLVPIMLAIIQKEHPLKKFRTFPLLQKYHDEFGWTAPSKALEALVASGKVSENRGWYKLEAKFPELKNLKMKEA